MLSAHGLNYGINKVQSSFAASDPLNKTQIQQQLQSDNTYWTYGGDVYTVSNTPVFSAPENLQDSAGGKSITISWHPRCLR